MDRFWPVFVCVWLAAGCSPPEDQFSVPRQREFARLLREAQSISGWIASSDTVVLALPDSVRVDVCPIIVAARSGFFLCSPIARSIVRVSRDGEFRNAFGRTGSGPGEFRGIVAAAADTLGNLFVLDILLARITCFEPGGGLVATIPVRNPFLIRHLCPITPDRIYLHHAPDTAGGGFLTLLESGVARGLIASPPEYEAYYYRGHLEGAVIAGCGGRIYETNAYSAAIRRVRGVEIEEVFGDRTPGFQPPAASRGFRSIHELQIAVMHATLVRKLFLVQGRQLLLQELVRFRGPSRSIDRRLMVYDTSGVCLGDIAGDAGAIETSDGDVLVKVHNPMPPPGRWPGGTRPRLPKLVVLRLRGMDS